MMCVLTKWVVFNNRTQPDRLRPEEWLWQLCCHASVHEGFFLKKEKKKKKTSAQFVRGCFWPAKQWGPHCRDRNRGGTSLGWLHVRPHPHPRLFDSNIFGLDGQTGFIYRQHSFAGVPLDERGFGKWTQDSGGKRGILREFSFKRAARLFFMFYRQLKTKPRSWWSLSFQKVEVICGFIRVWLQFFFLYQRSTWPRQEATAGAVVHKEILLLKNRENDDKIIIIIIKQQSAHHYVRQQRTTPASCCSEPQEQDQKASCC